jgi:hypothetical protein
MVVDIYVGGGFRKLIVTNDDPLGQTNANWIQEWVFQSSKFAVQAIMTLL